MNGISSASLSIGQRLKGKVAIITGGASGFGEATARLFVQHGAKVIIADVNDTKGISLCNEIITSNNKNANNNNNNNGDSDTKIISYVHCDVANESDVEKLVDEAMAKHGKLDIMFNNAGISGDLNPSILAATNHNFRKVFDVNVFGSFLGAKHAARVMIPNKTGVILFTASLLSTMGGRDTPHAYTMSKHAISGLTKNLCIELGQHGIRVNAISPSYVPTPLLCNALGMSKEKLDNVISQCGVLKGVNCEAMDVANAALYLASDDSKYVSGLNLGLDGGYSVVNPSFVLALEKFNN